MHNYDTYIVAFSGGKDFTLSCGGLAAQAKINYMKKDTEHIIMDLDSFTEICGQFYCDTDNTCNNGYNCKHLECEEADYFNNSNECVDLRSYIIQFELNRGESKSSIQNKLKTNYYDDIKYLKSIGITRVGKCYSFSCPLAYQADKEDVLRIDPSWTSSEESESSIESRDLMVVSKEMLQL